MITSTGAPARRDRWLVFGFWLIYVLAAMHTTVVTDTARDLMAAWDIVRAEQFVLRGPELYTTWTLGPIWYYLLALPLALTHSAAFAALMIAVIAGAKFPVAYRLGAFLGDQQTARLALFAAALPGWWLFEWLVSSHTNLAMVCVLSLVLQLSRWSRGGSEGRLVAAGLLFSLALHAHPTGLFWWFLFPLAAMVRKRSQHALSGRAITLALLAFLLPFLPMLWDEMRQGWPMLAGTREFVVARADKSIAAQLPGFLVDWMGLNPIKVPGQFLPHSGHWGSIASGLMAALWFAAMLGWLLRADWRRQLAVAALLIAAAWFALWLRPEVPFWMVYALTPALMLAWVFGLQSLLARLPRSSRSFLVSATGVTVFLLFAALAGVRWQQAGTGWVSVPYRVVGAYSAPNQMVDAHEPNAAFPVAAQENWQRWLCGQSRDLSLHGDGAALQRLSQGTLRLLHCADDQHWQIGGVAGQPVALYPQFALAELGLVPGESFGAMGRVPVRMVIKSAESQSDELIRDYPPWPLTMGLNQSLRLPLPSNGERLLVISNLRAVFNELAPPRLVVHGSVLDPVARTAVSWFFRVPANDDAILNLDAGDLRWIEVLEIETQENLRTHPNARSENSMGLAEPPGILWFLRLLSKAPVRQDTGSKLHRAGPVSTVLERATMRALYRREPVCGSLIHQGCRCEQDRSRVSQTFRHGHRGPDAAGTDLDPRRALALRQ